MAYATYRVFANQDAQYLRGINELATSIKQLFQRAAQVFALKDFEKARKGQLLLEVRADKKALNRIRPQYLEVLTNEDEFRDTCTPLRVKAGYNFPIKYHGARRDLLGEVI